MDELWLKYDLNDLQVVGCDHMLYSRKRIDRCGVCDGKADTCVTEAFRFTQKVTGISDIELNGFILTILSLYCISSSLRWST